jgi:hypothetical protein
MIALIGAIDRGLGISTAVASLRERAANFEFETQRALRESEPLREVVRSLEQRIDAIHGSTPHLLTGGEFTSDLPSSDEVIAGLEQYLREQRDSGRPDAAGIG